MQMFAGNSRARILNTYSSHPWKSRVRRWRIHPDLFAGTCIFHRVLNQVGQNLIELVAVSEYFLICVDCADSQFAVILLGQWRKRGNAVDGQFSWLT